MDKVMDHLPHLLAVAKVDVAEIHRKEQTYRGSWRWGGGVNAWHMVRRKIDRLMVMLAPLSEQEIDAMRSYAAASGEIGPGDMVRLPVDAYVRVQTLLRRAADAEDIFRAMDADTSGEDGTVLAEVRDLRRYLLLFESRMLAEMVRRAEPQVLGSERLVPRAAPVPAEDSSRHAERVTKCDKCDDTGFVRQTRGIDTTVTVCGCRK